MKSISLIKLFLYEALQITELGIDKKLKLKAASVAPSFVRAKFLPYATAEMIELVKQQDIQQIVERIDGNLAEIIKISNGLTEEKRNKFFKIIEGILYYICKETHKTG